MTCCGRCRVCRHEWDELEHERVDLKTELAEAVRLLGEATREINYLNNLDGKEDDLIDRIGHFIEKHRSTT